MHAPIRSVFSANMYLQRSNRFSTICEWFGRAQFSRCTSIRQYVLNTHNIKSRMPIRDNSGFNVELESGEIPYILFIESQVFLNRCLSNFCAQLALHRVGCLSWAIVTTYYSSFFALSGLIRLQGKARIATYGERDLPRGFFVCLSSTARPCCVVFTNWKNHHKQTCSDFYYAYRQFDLFGDSLQDLLSLRLEDILEEVVRRNAYNYGLETGYRELDSPDYERRDLRRITAQRVKSLPDLVTEPDPELGYMAKACSRMIMLGAASWRIAKSSPILRPVFDKFMTDRERFIHSIYQGNDEIGKCLLRFTRGRMHLS